MNPRPTPEDLLGTFLEAHPTPSPAEVEALCTEHPDHASDLRRLLKQAAPQQPATDQTATLFHPKIAPVPASSGPWSITPGKTLGDFTLIQRLGRGGMGEVWEAQQKSLGRKVALKLLLPERVDQKGLDFFAREARAGGRLAHPGIISVFGTGETDGLHWISMELIEDACDLRHSLEEIREETELPEDYYSQVAQFTAEVADALEAAHASHVIHRDLKPGNIMVTPDEHPKVADFGLAKLVDENSLSVAGDVAGTYFYMSPEQVATKRAGLDHRTDIFSLGVVLYEMLTLVRPFEGDTTEQVAQKILWEEAPSPTTIRSRVPRDLAVICGKAMEKDPGRRYQTMGELAADLRRHLANEPILAKPSGPLVRLQKWVRRNPTKSTALGLLAVALVVVLNLYSKLFDEQKATAQALTTASQERDLKSEALLQIKREQQATQTALEQVHQEKEATTAALLTAQTERDRAEEAKTEASDQRDQAQQRADELQQVSDFQAEQLSAVDAEAMGLAIRRMVLEGARASGERAGREAEVLDEEQAELTSLLAGTDFTGIALDVLDEQVFEGALKALEGFEDQPLVQAQLLQTVATTLLELGLLEQALEPQEQALEIYRGELGDEHPATLHSISNLGVLLRVQGKLDEAEPLLRGALEVRRRKLGDEHPSTLTSVGNLGNLLYSQGKLGEAEPLLREALDVNRRKLGNEHPETLVSIGNLGNLLYSQGKPHEAGPLYSEALEGSRRKLGNEHPNTLRIINNLGLLLSGQGKHDEAEPLLREVLELSRRKLGDEHPDTLSSINHLGVLFRRQGKLDEAEPLFREALECSRRKLGDEHPTTLLSINNLARILKTQGKFDEAEPLYREALEVSRRKLGDEHPTTLFSINNLGLLLSAQGKYDEAEPLYRELLEVSRRKLGDEHRDTLFSINSLGNVLKAQGKLAEAEPLLREALNGYRRRLGDGHSGTLKSMNYLGLLLRAQGKYDEAEALLREALEGSRRQLGDEHPITLTVSQSLDALLKEKQESESPPPDPPSDGKDGDNP